jgi:hypothetical protein
MMDQVSMNSPYFMSLVLLLFIGVSAAVSYLLQGR